MRGKHKNAAAHRRDRDELVSEAEDGQHRAEKAEKALAELQEKSEKQIAGLRADVAAAVREREEGASQRLTQAEAQIRALMGDRDAAIQEHQEIRVRWNNFAAQAIALLQEMGFTNTEAIEVLVASVSLDRTTKTLTTGLGNNNTKKLGHEGGMAIQRARGQRNSVDPLKSVQRDGDTPEGVARVVRELMSPEQIGALVALLQATEVSA